jgi:glycosyltransferase involved in cell wall biosynthesis
VRTHVRRAPVRGRKAEAPPEVSVVIPCLNEADTLAICIEKARRALREHDIDGEIIVADNGSTDGSIEIAMRMGARAVNVAARGYGSALMGGIAAARGRFVIMGDADDSYDFLELPKFVARLRGGDELVQGCRLPAGGGRVAPSAMPWLHRWLGNPLFSWLARRWFRAPVHDVYCGFRGFTRQLYARLGQRCVGMEFATEMIIKSSLYGARISEVPITLHRDGRKAHAPHLKTFRDGWRTLRLFLVCSPRWLFLLPGLALVALGVLGYLVALPGLALGGVTFDAHTLLVSSLAVLLGYQCIVFAICTKTFAITQGLLPEDRLTARFFQVVNLERGLVIACAALLAGTALVIAAVNQWRLADFGALEYARTMRLVVPGVTLTALGFQTVVSSFLVSILGMRRL